MCNSMHIYIHVYMRMKVHELYIYIYTYMYICGILVKGLLGWATIRSKDPGPFCRDLWRFYGGFGIIV